MPRRLTWFLLAAVFLAASLAYLGRVPSLPTRDPVPSPNGYDDFVAAGPLVRSSLTPDDRTDPAKVTAFVATNRSALERLRLGLGKASLVPPYHPTNASTHLEQIGGMKRLALLLAAEAQDAHAHQQWDHLVTASTQGIDFGLRLARGGVLIDQLVATACEAIARAPLEKALPELPAASARAAATNLLNLDATREPFQKIRLSEEEFVVRNSPWKIRVAWRLFLRRRALPAIEKAEVKAHENVRATRQLILHLAAHAHSLERGTAPVSAEALVPEYLTALPRDPATGLPIRLPPSTP